MQRRDHLANRAQSPSTSDSSVLNSLQALRQRDHGRFLHELASLVAEIPAHPHADEGWWCSHSSLMFELLPYLADEPSPHQREKQHLFRNRVAHQLSHCRRCCVNYHKAVTSFRMNRDSEIKVVRRRTQALFAWDIKRLLPKLCKYVQAINDSLMDFGIDILREGGEAFLEAMLSFQLCSHRDISKAIGCIFTIASRPDPNRDVVLLTKDHGFIPSGLIALCFHQKYAVNTWAHRMYRKLTQEYKPQSSIIHSVLKRAAEQLESYACGEYGERRGFVLAVDRKTAWEGFGTLLNGLNKSTVTKFSAAFGNARLFKIIVFGVRDTMETIVVAASSCLISILRNVDVRTLFVPDVVLPEELLNDVLASFEKSCSQLTRHKLLDLIAPIIARARELCSDQDVFRLFRNAFSFFNRAINSRLDDLSESGRVGSKKGPSTLSSERRDIVRSGASLLNWYYTHSAPFLPIADTKIISRFVLTVLNDDGKNEQGWILLRTVLITDVLNLIRFLRHPSDTRHIAHTFISKRPGSVQHWHGEDGIIKNFIKSLESDEKEFDWLEPVWRGLQAGYHVPGSADEREAVSEHEVRILLDLHRLIGMVDPLRLKSEIADSRNEKKSKAECGEAPWKNLTGHGLVAMQLCERLSLMQTAISERFFVACESNGDQRWWRELPFHATHLLASSHKEVAHKAFLTLKKSCDLLEVSCAGPQSKLVASILKTDSEGVGMVADGCLSAMRIISALGCLNAMRTYPSFLLWFRVLLESKYVSLLESGNSDWALGVVETFFDSWRSFQQSTEPKEFNEVSCRVFSNLRDLWSHFCILESWESEDNYIYIDRREAALRRLLKRLLEMNTLKNDVARSAWVTTVCYLAKSWKDVNHLREDVIALIEYHESNRGTLSYEDCQRIADSANLKEVDVVLKRWSRSVNQKQTPRAKPKQTTTIDQYFRPVVEGNTMVRAVVEKKDSITPFIGKRFASKNALDVHFLRPASNIRVAHKIPSQSSALGDLRRDVKASRKDPSWFARPSGSQISSKMGTGEPGKTKFELLVEQQIAAKAAAKAAERGSRLHGMGEVHDLDADEPRHKGRFLFPSLTTKPSKKAQGRSITVDVDADQIGVVENTYVVPLEKRVFEPRFLEKVHRAILMLQQDTSLTRKPNESTADSPIVYRNVESYVRYWEPIIKEEFRSSLQNIIAEERTLWERESSKKGFSSWRSEFEVEGIVESVGYAQILSIRCSREKSERKGDNKSKECEFHVSRAQSSDILLLHILPPRYVEPSEVKERTVTALALVKKVVRKAGEFSLILNVAFEHVSDAPGNGRRILVSKLTSISTFQRQLDSLWTLNKVCDGALWSVLEPRKGMSVNEDVYNEQLNIFKQSINLRKVFIDRMLHEGVWNESQANAIYKVVKSCAPLFCPKHAHYGPSERVDDHGSVTLIQGPPGTGKTSTILGLLSSLLSFGAEDLGLKQVRISFESGPLTMQVPKVRILVCAPSNAAVDELMVRVMEKGLRTRHGSTASPRMVRIGGGTNNEVVKMLEIWNVAERCVKRDGAQDSSSPSAKRVPKLQNELSTLNSRIGVVDKERKDCGARCESEVMGVSSKMGKKSYGELTDQLTSLHRRKKEVILELSEAWAVVRDNEATRKQEDLQHVARVLNGCSLVFATLSSSGHELLRSIGARFDVIIVDEAAQCGEPEVLIPIACSNSARNGKLSASHVVLVGDPKQLPATVISTNKSVQRALGRSLFERIAESSPASVHMLRTQYRMHPAISLFPSNHFYGGLLLNGENVTSRQIHRSYHGDKKLRFGPLTFLDTSSSNTREVRNSSGSLYNSAEASIVIAAITALVRLYQGEEFMDNIVVLSPYKQQVGTLKSLIMRNRALRDLSIEVSTVDGIQGREKSIVFLSTVRSGHSHGIGFVDDDRRMNVAITRARHSLIVVGNATALSQSSTLWTSLISHCRSRSLLTLLPQSELQFFPESNMEVPIKCAPSIPELVDLPEPDNSGRALCREGAENNIPDVSIRPSREIQLRSKLAATPPKINIPNAVHENAKGLKVDARSSIGGEILDEVSTSAPSGHANSSSRKRTAPDSSDLLRRKEKRLCNDYGGAEWNSTKEKSSVSLPLLRSKIPEPFQQNKEPPVVHQIPSNSSDEPESAVSPQSRTYASDSSTGVKDIPSKPNLPVLATKNILKTVKHIEDASVCGLTKQPEHQRSVDISPIATLQKSEVEKRGSNAPHLSKDQRTDFESRGGQVSVSTEKPHDQRLSVFQRLGSLDSTEKQVSNTFSMAKSPISSFARQVVTTVGTKPNLKRKLVQSPTQSNPHCPEEVQRRFSQPFQKSGLRSKNVYSQKSQSEPDSSSAADGDDKHDVGEADIFKRLGSSCRQPSVNRTQANNQRSFRRERRGNNGNYINTLNRSNVDQNQAMATHPIPMTSFRNAKRVNNDNNRRVGNGTVSDQKRLRPVPVTPTGHLRSTNETTRERAKSNARLIARSKGKKRGLPSVSNNHEHAKKPKVAGQASSRNGLRQEGQSQKPFSLEQSQKQMRQTQEMIRRVA